MKPLFAMVLAVACFGTVQARGGQVTALTLQSDHSFQDHRIALAAQVINWLRRIGPQ